MNEKMHRKMNVECKKIFNESMKIADTMVSMKKRKPVLFIRSFITHNVLRKMINE